MIIAAVRRIDLCWSPGCAIVVGVSHEAVQADKHTSRRCLSDTVQLGHEGAAGSLIGKKNWVQGPCLSDKVGNVAPSGIASRRGIGINIFGERNLDGL